ncbi:hypothetical protein JZ751_028152 [Albula glossodonta]|uniref:Uncharacterized protein n=1 Tax=Albula glossodonta TaxID=121402 RepID=A0A8T2PAU5_9TELE|nr:hypothetical protein JZ751_028152 [Albula glossodonta]
MDELEMCDITLPMVRVALHHNFYCQCGLPGKGVFKGHLRGVALLHISLPDPSLHEQRGSTELEEWDVLYSTHNTCAHVCEEPFIAVSLKTLLECGALDQGLFQSWATSDDIEGLG